MPAAPGAAETFEAWFARHLGQDERQVAVLIGDPRATHFLIAWSILESSCFDGFVTEAKLADFSRRLSEAAELRREDLLEHGEYFHSRYQDNRVYANLVHGRDSTSFKALLGKRYERLGDDDLVHLLVYVVYRYRNNIFHGNKGVSSWLNYADQIDRCIAIMQILISGASSQRAAEQTVT